MDYLHKNYHGTYILNPSCVFSKLFAGVCINQVGSYHFFFMDNDFSKLPMEIRGGGCIAMLICGTIRLFEVEDRYVERMLDEQNAAGSPRLKMRGKFWNLLGMIMEGGGKELFQFCFVRRLLINKRVHATISSRYQE